MNPQSTRYVSTALVHVADAPPASAPIPLLVHPAPPANGNAAGTTRKAPELVNRREAVTRLYKEHYQSMIDSAARSTGSYDDAGDAVQEAFLILLTSPNRNPSRTALWAIVRDVCRDRVALKGSEDPYVDDPYEDDDDSAGGWLTRALRG
jgi:hypothetical protein